MCITGCKMRPLYSHADKLSTNESVIDSSCSFSIKSKKSAERDGQKLRIYVNDNLRNLHLLDDKYNITIELDRQEKSYAVGMDSNAKRLLFSYIADIVIIDNHTMKVCYNKKVVVKSMNNISAQGDVLFSIYRRYDDHLLKELAYRLVENIKVFLSYENRV